MSLIEPSKSFSLKPGEAARTPDDALQIGFEAVVADSRCPKGVQCIRAGEAIVRIWLQRAGGERETHQLQLPPGPKPALDIQGQELQLLSVEPYPVAGRVIAKEDYVATLALVRSKPAEAER